MLLIGSQAALHRGIDLGRVPSDTDVIATPDETRALIRMLRDENEAKSAHPISDGNKTLIVTRSLGRIEVETAWSDSTGMALMDLTLRSMVRPAKILCGRWACNVADGNTLLALKMSHRYRKDSPHFNKTRTDIMALRGRGFVVPEHLREWLKLREKETYAYAHPKLNQSKMGFFAGDGVPYIYDHDSLHVAMSRNGVPSYTLYQKDGSEVAVDRKKWDALPLATQLDSVVEEACVLALERSQIPSPNGLTPDDAFDMALMKVCTSITSGWWREFAWEHYDEAQYLRSATPRWQDYVGTFRRAIADGVVKPHG